MKNSGFVTALAFATSSFANELLTLDKVEADINEVQLQRNLWNLNHIADENGGNRAAGRPGYNKSVDFVLERAKRFDHKLDFYTVPFTVPWYTVNNVSLTGPDGESVFVRTPTANIGGSVTGQLADTPIDDVNGSMCTEADYEGVDVAGKIALIKRGICGFLNKVQLAASHGAIGVVMYNSPASGTNYAGPDIGFADPDSIVPVVIPTLETGTAWKARLVAGEVLTVTISNDVTIEQRVIENVIAETKEGNPDSVIMLGAHLDSVPAGPGVNDDGSGVTALMEIMESFQKYTGFVNKVRFGWWGAEEQGLIGSLFYAESLSAEEASKIKFYFNYDMIGSIQPQYWIYADGVADEFGAQEIWDYIASQGKKPEWYGAYTNDSDYVGFRDRGIPVSGIFTGAGDPEDPCYHSACDTIDNINYEALTINSKAAARAAAKLALSLKGLPGKCKRTSVKRRAQSHSARKSFFDSP